MTQQASGFTATYVDPNTGGTYDNAWIQISNILYRPYMSCMTVFDVYISQSAYQNGMAPVCPNQRLQVNYGSADWNSYFDPAIMDETGHNIQKQSLTYLEYQI